MRTKTILFSLAVASLASGAGGCKWTDFDDLEDTTWVRSTQAPDIGAADYAIQIAGISTSPSGGQLAVLSQDAPNFSTLDFTASGDPEVGASPLELGTQKIGSLQEVPVLATDATGHIAIIERSVNGGNYALVYGTAAAPAGLEFPSALNPAPPPDAGVFVPNGANSDFVFMAGTVLYTVASTGGAPVACVGTDDVSAPLQASALATDGMNLWVWTKGGALLEYPLTALACGGDATTPGALPAPSNVYPSNGGFMPGPGARVHIAPTTATGSYAILVANPPGSRTTTIQVADLNVAIPVGSPVTIEGVQSSTLATLEGTTYLALGIPGLAVGADKVVAGGVQLHTFDTMTGALGATPALTLYDAQPESGQTFGRALTTMSFNGNPILVVGADSEVFAYYRTALYDHLP